MAETPDQTALQRRAMWIGLKTLRQRPKMVGETATGEPVFEVRSVRLVLRDEAGHFSRLAQCSKCGREVPGAAVMSPADLDRPPHSVICKDCVRASVAASPLQPERRAVRTEPPAVPAQSAEEQPSKSAQPADDVRLAAVEVQLEAATTRLAEMADVHREQSTESDLQEALRQGLAQIRADVMASSTSGDARMAAMEEEIKAITARLAKLDQSTESRLQEALRKGLAEVGADVMASSEAGTARLVAAHEQARQDVDGLAQVVEAQQGRLVSLSAVLTDTRAEVQRLVESNSELSRVQAELERRIEETVGDAGADLEGLERRLRDDVSTLTQVVETLRGDIEGPLGQPVRTGLAMVVQAIQELARARDAVKGSVDAVLANARDAEARMDALTSAIEDGGGRLRALELRMQKSIDRLTGALQVHRRQVGVASATNGGTDHRVGGASTGEPTPGELLDGLDRQLREAEGRLARLTGLPDGETPPADG